jgi:hypothetical protein
MSNQASSKMLARLEPLSKGQLAKLKWGNRNATGVTLRIASNQYNYVLEKFGFLLKPTQIKKLKSCRKKGVYISFTPQQLDKVKQGGWLGAVAGPVGTKIVDDIIGFPQKMVGLITGMVQDPRVYFPEAYANLQKTLQGSNIPSMFLGPAKDIRVVKEGGYLYMLPKNPDKKGGFIFVDLIKGYLDAKKAKEQFAELGKQQEKLMKEKERDRLRSIELENLAIKRETDKAAKEEMLQNIRALAEINSEREAKKLKPYTMKDFRDLMNPTEEKVLEKVLEKYPKEKYPKEYPKDDDLPIPILEKKKRPRPSLVTGKGKKRARPWGKKKHPAKRVRF